MVGRNTPGSSRSLSPSHLDDERQVIGRKADQFVGGDLDINHFQRGIDKHVVDTRQRETPEKCTSGPVTFEHGLRIVEAFAEFSTHE